MTEQARDNMKEKALKSAGWSTVQGFGNQAILFIVFLLLARILDPASFGIIAMAQIFLDLINIVIFKGFSDAIIQREGLEEKHLDSVFWVNLFFGSIVTSILFVFSGSFASLFDEPELQSVLRWMSLSVFIMSVQVVQYSILRRNLKYKYLAISSICALLLSGGAGVFMAMKGFGVWSLVVMQIAKASIETVILWFSSDWRPKLSISFHHFYSMLRFGIYIIMSDFLGFIVRRTASFMIGFYFGATILGYYSIAYRMFGVITNLTIYTLSSVAVPLFSRMQSDMHRLKDVYLKAIHGSVTINFPVFAGLFIFANEFITVLFGDQWVQSIPIIRVLCFMGALYAVLYFNDSLFISIGKPGIKLHIQVLQTILSIVAFLLAIQWGIVVVVISLVLVTLLMAPISLYQVRKNTQTTAADLIEHCGPAFVSTVLMSGIILLFKNVLFPIESYIINLLVYVPLGVASYVLAMRLIFQNHYALLLGYGSVITSSLYRKRA